MAATTTIQVNDVQTLLDYRADRGENSDIIAGLSRNRSTGEVESCEINADHSADVNLDSADPDSRSRAILNLTFAIRGLIKKEPGEGTLRYKDHIISTELFRESVLAAAPNSDPQIDRIFAVFGEAVVESQQNSQAEATYRPVQTLPPGNVSQLKLETLQTGVANNIDSGSEGLNIPIRNLQALLNDHAEDGDNPRYLAEFDYEENQCYVQFKPKEEYQAQLESIGLPTIKSIANNSLRLAVEALLQTEPDDKTLEYKGKEISVKNLKEIIIASQNFDINEIFANAGGSVGEPQQSSQAEEATSPPTKAPTKAQAQAQALPPGNAWLTALKETQEAQASRPGITGLDANTEDKKASSPPIWEKFKGVIQKAGHKKTSYGDLPSEIPKVGQTKSEADRTKEKALLAIRHPTAKYVNLEGINSKLSSRLEKNPDYQYSESEIRNDDGIGDNDL